MRFNDLTNIPRLWAKGFKVYETFSVKFERQELVSPAYHAHTFERSDDKSFSMKRCRRLRGC